MLVLVVRDVASRTILELAAEFRALVRAYRAAPSPGGLEAVVEGLLAHQLGESFHARRAELGDAARLVEDLRLDSLALVELSFAAEDFAP